LPNPLSGRAFNGREYACEVLGTALLCICGLSAVTWDFGKGLPMSTWIPSVSIRLLLTGLMFSGSGSLIAISPIGKLSGAHLNPGVTAAFWIRRKMHWHDAVLYIVSQFIGAAFGCVLLAVVWGQYYRSVNFGMTLPGASFGPLVAGGAEFLMTAGYITLILLFVSSHRLMRKTPLMNWLVVAFLVWVEAPVSGTSINAARSFGPALVASNWTDYGIYLVCPTFGACAAAIGFPLVQSGERKILTAKLFHSSKYPSIFKS
jgi:aquaporin Z